MTLSPGVRLGPYEISSLVGVGGMGEVSRATDSSLGRQVAIKVLPESVAHDPERLARFDREARTLAALNHANIAVVHGLEKIDGTTALVMEPERLTTVSLGNGEVTRLVAGSDLHYAQPGYIIYADDRPA